MLRANSVALRPFHVLVGQNATGKTTLLSALQFLSDALAEGVHFAVEKMAPSFYDLCFHRDSPLEIAVELEVPSPPTDEGRTKRLRYEVEVGIEEPDGLRVLRENLFILPDENSPRVLQHSLFGESPVNTLTDKPPKNWRKVVSKTRDGRDYFRDEKTKWNNVFKFGPDKLALGSLPEDPDRFAVSIAARNTLRDGIRTLALDAREMRLSSPPGGSSRIELDGSNLPYVVRDLKRRDAVLFDQWVQHVAIAVVGLKGIDVREREDDKHLVLEAHFLGDHQEPVPSWLLSDGTLRLMALTLLSYASGDNGGSDIFLVEEPENGLHPLAIQIAFEALSQSLQSTQFLCATHSPIFLAHTGLEQALVFRRDRKGGAIVRRGEEIEELRDWASSTSISDLFVTGVLA